MIAWVNGRAKWKLFRYEIKITTDCRFGGVGVAPKPTTHGFPPTGGLPPAGRNVREILSLQSFSPFSENIVEKRITTRCSATSRRYEQLEKSTVSGVLNRVCACVCVCIENQIFTLDTVLDTMPEANNILWNVRIKGKSKTKKFLIHIIKALKNFFFSLSFFSIFRNESV